MKSFIVALALALAVIAFVIFNMTALCGKIDALLDLTASLPRSQAQFDAQKDEIGHSVDALWQAWDRAVPRIALTAGYENVNRADEAVISLYNAFQNNDGDDFSLAVLSLEDGLRRLRELESFRFSSIF